MGLFDLISNVLTSAIKWGNFESIKESAPNQIGVYIMSYNGKVMYVGRAIEGRPGQSPSGLRKRLQEHWRGSANCKKELHKYRHEISVRIKICGTVQEAKALESELIRQYDTVASGWNLRYES